jgi:hypothetical protein
MENNYTAIDFYLADEWTEVDQFEAQGKRRDGRQSGHLTSETAEMEQ